jgi:hypothetical protein
MARPSNYMQMAFGRKGFRLNAVAAYQYLRPETGGQGLRVVLRVRGVNAEDLYFGPTAPDGKEANWIQTVPEKGWFCLLRLYSPIEPWFDKTWRPGEIELVE